jgi:hypothetical protein
MAGEDAPKVTGQVSVTRPRLDEKPWGGRGLARYGLDLPPGVPVGEALVTADDAEIVSGAGAGVRSATLSRRAMTCSDRRHRGPFTAARSSRCWSS